MNNRFNNTEKKHRIAFVYNHSFFLGGGERSFYELIRSLDRSCFEPVVFVPGIGEIEQDCIKAGIPVFVISLPSLKDLLSLRQFNALIWFKKILKKSNVDIIHANGSRACLYSVVAGVLLGIPVIWHVRETKRDYFFYDGFLGAFSRKIICVSNAVALQRFSRMPEWIKKKIEVIYNGVDTSVFRLDRFIRRRIRDDLGVGTEILIGLVGNIIPLKGHDFFLRGMSRAKKIKPDLPIKALFIGRPLDKNFSRRIKDIIYQEGLEKEVIFIDYTSRITEILSALDIFVLPSRREGFSRSILEAMSFGLPILATRIAAIKEAVVDGENGILVDNGDERAMASAIIKLCENENLGKEMGERNQKRAARLFDLKCHTASIEKLYKKVVYSNGSVS